MGCKFPLWTSGAPWAATNFHAQFLSDYGCIKIGLSFEYSNGRSAVYVLLLANMDLHIIWNDNICKEPIEKLELLTDLLIIGSASVTSLLRRAKGSNSKYYLAIHWAGQMGQPVFSAHKWHNFIDCFIRKITCYNPNQYWPATQPHGSFILQPLKEREQRIMWLIRLLNVPASQFGRALHCPSRINAHRRLTVSQDALAYMHSPEYNHQVRF